MTELWYKYSNRFIVFLLFAFAFSHNLSISITQSCLGLALVSCFVDYLYFRKVRYRSNLAGSAKQYYNDYRPWRWQPVFGFLLAWVIYRIFHIFLATDHLKELIEFREVWLLLIVPLVFHRLHRPKYAFAFIFFMLAGAAIPGIKNLLSIAQLNYYIPAMRGTGLLTSSSLTYTGIIVPIFFVGIASSWALFTYKKKLWATLFALLTLSNLPGIVIAQTRGGYIAVVLTLLLTMVFLFKKRFIYILPILLVLVAVFAKDVSLLKGYGEHGLPDWGTHLTSLEQRVDLWQAGLKMWLESPILGIGTTDFDLLYSKYRVADAKLIAYTGSHMHNDLFNSLVLYGSIGFTIMLMFFVHPFITYLRKFMRGQINLSRQYMLFFMAAIIGFAFLGLSQCHFTDEEPQMVFWSAYGLYLRFSAKVKE